MLFSLKWHILIIFILCNICFLITDNPLPFLWGLNCGDISLVKKIINLRNKLWIIAVVHKQQFFGDMQFVSLPKVRVYTALWRNVNEYHLLSIITRLIILLTHKNNTIVVNTMVVNKEFTLQKQTNLELA